MLPLATRGTNAMFQLIADANPGADPFWLAPNPALSTSPIAGRNDDDEDDDDPFEDFEEDDDDDFFDDDEEDDDFFDDDEEDDDDEFFPFDDD
jgi:hypothetical protein